MDVDTLGNDDSGTEPPPEPYPKEIDQNYEVDPAPVTGMVLWADTLDIETKTGLQVLMGAVNGDNRDTEPFTPVGAHLPPCVTGLKDYSAPVLQWSLHRLCGHV